MTYVVGNENGGQNGDAKLTSIRTLPRYQNKMTFHDKKHETRLYSEVDSNSFWFQESYDRETNFQGTSGMGRWPTSLIR